MKLRQIIVHWIQLNIKVKASEAISHTVLSVCGIDIAQSHGWQPPLYSHICELRNFARLKISTFRPISSRPGQLSLLWVSCKLTPSDLSRVYHVSEFRHDLSKLTLCIFLNKLDQEIQSLLQDCTIGGHQASLSCLCQGARHILLINCDLTLLWLHIIGRHLGTGHGYHGASHIMLAAGPKYCCTADTLSLQGISRWKQVTNPQ